MTARDAQFATRRYGAVSPLELALVLGEMKAAPTEPQVTFIPVEIVTPLSQWRKAFPRIPELAEDIARRGILNPIIVARWSEQGAARYIRAVNMLWNVSHTIDEIPCSIEDGRRVYHIVIAGERRFRACRHLWQRGCDACNVIYGTEKPGKCFARHLPKGLRVDIRENPSPIDMLSTQYAENNYEPPDPDEQAVGYKLYFELLRVAQPNLTLFEYARRVGRSPDTIRKALKYCELPEAIRVPVRDGIIRYGIALEIMRLLEQIPNEKVALELLQRAIDERLTVTHLRRICDKEITDYKAGQIGMFGTAIIERLKVARRRRTIDASIATFLQRIEGFIFVVLRQYSQGNAGKPDSPFATKSAVKNVLKIYDLLTQLVPHIESSMTAREQSEMRDARKRLDPAIATIRRLADVD